MSKIELWKVRRELWRIVDQAKGLVAVRQAETALAWVRERLKPRRVDVYDGQIDYGPKVAIFLIYQPTGLAASVLFTISHLIRNGWSPVVVSNAPVSPEDLDRLKSQSVKVILRDNIGYDFGGYYDAVHRLRSDGVTPDRVLIMNDSSWFPLRENDDTLRRLEALNAGLAGHIYKIEDDTAKWRDHVEAHLLMFSKAAWTHPEMKTFWTDYVMTSNKAATIDRGERGVTHAALRTGLPVAALWDREKALEWLQGLSDQEMQSVMRELVLHSDGYQQQIDGILAAAEAGNPQLWRDDFLKWTQYNMSNSLQILASAAYLIPAQKAGMINFMKKSSELRYHLARHQLIAAVDGGEIAPLHPDVDAEIRARIASWRPEWNWREKSGYPPFPAKYDYLNR